MFRQVFVTQPRHQTMPVLDGIDLQIQKLCRQDDWLAEEPLKSNLRERGSYIKRLLRNDRREGDIALKGVKSNSSR